MTKAIGLVTVLGGVAYVAESDHVDIRIVDMDNRDGPTVLPKGIGFEELSGIAGLVEGVDVVFETEDA